MGVLEGGKVKHDISQRDPSTSKEAANQAGELRQRLRLHKKNVKTNREIYHEFLIKHRVYCEFGSGFKLCLEYASTVRNLNGRDTVFCSEHAGRLDAVRKSDNQQDKK